MGNSHSSFTYEDRVMIEVMLKAKKTQTEIAAELGKTRSAVCQEIHRHAMWKDSPIPLKPDYRAAEAQYQAEQDLRKRGRKRTKLTKREEGIILTHLDTHVYVYLYTYVYMYAHLDIKLSHSNNNDNSNCWKAICA